MGDETEAELGRALAAALEGAGAGPVVIGDLRRLSGGASRETWSFTAITGTDRLRLVLQRVRGGLTMAGPSIAVEDALITAAEHAGVPVPPTVVGAAGCADALGAARISLQVDGEALGPRIVRQDRFAAARSVLPAQCGRALAAIHSIDPAAVPGLVEVDALARLREGLDLVDEHRPAFELALRWLHDHRPPPRPVGVVHGDFRVGNLLVDETGLQAVLDWELAHLGDPLEDLGWLCVRAWRFGGDGEVGGVGPIDDLLDAYAGATGEPVSAHDVRWWIVAGTLTWGLICAVQARRHLDGHVRSVELATIGRRVCETEYDLLDLIGITHDGILGNDDPGNDDPDSSDPANDDPDSSDPANDDPDSDDPDSDDPANDDPDSGDTANGDSDSGGEEPAPLDDRQGRPTAAELVEAVREHLAEVVAPQLEGAAAFQLKVAGNALGIVERELRTPPRSVLDASMEGALAAAIRNGAELEDDVVVELRRAVVDRLRVANPKWLRPEDQPENENEPPSR